MKIEELRFALKLNIVSEHTDATFWDSRRVLLDAMPTLIRLVEAVGRWQGARSYGDSHRAAAEVAEAYAKLEALP